MFIPFDIECDIMNTNLTFRINFFYRYMVPISLVDWTADVKDGSNYNSDYMELTSVSLWYNINLQKNPLPFLILYLCVWFNRPHVWPLNKFAVKNTSNFHFFKGANVNVSQYYSTLYRTSSLTVTLKYSSIMQHTKYYFDAL